ncbi:MAG: hypothetical protein ABIV63_04580 [Caldimonas sp.]
MNTTYRCALGVLLSLAAAMPAAAQARAFPQNALRGAMVFGNEGQITLNGRAASLTPGSRVRDQANRIVLPVSLAGAKWLVHYTVEIGGAQVRDVWILRPEEAAIRPWPTTLEQANTWVYDATTMTWVKP